MIDANLIYSKILFQANVFDNQDPLLLGRIRASGQTDNVQDTYNAIPDWDEQTGPWSTKDPFVYLPFLPYFVSQVPQNEELIQVIYQNPRVQYSNQFYIQGPFSSPMLTSFQDKTGADSMLGTGLSTRVILQSEITMELTKTIEVSVFIPSQVTTLYWEEEVQTLL